MKTFIIRVSSTPDHPEYGYGDHFEIINDHQKIISGGHCSTCPNPFSPTTKKPYTERYGWIQLGTYSLLCINHSKYGKCFLVNGGGEVPGRYPNSNHNGKFILTEILIHTGGFGSKNPKWRGSAGCITIKPDEYEKTMNFFDYGEKVTLIIREFITSEIKETAMEQTKKKWYTSKTLIFNALSISILVITKLTDTNIIPTEYAALIIPIVNGILRIITKNQLTK